MSEHPVYLRMRHRVQVKPDQLIKIGDVAQVISKTEIRDKVVQLPLHQISHHDKNFVVVDAMKVIQALDRHDPSLDIQSIGGAQTILQVVTEKRQISYPYLLFVWFLLFVGAGLAVMNFHEDVSMLEVHHKIFTIITGKEVDKPLMLQVPYSIGLGLGMILFFNHVFKKRLNDEPSPLEVEMFNYQQDLDQYIIMHENDESETKLHGD